MVNIKPITVWNVMWEKNVITINLLYNSPSAKWKLTWKGWET